MQHRPRRDRQPLWQDTDGDGIQDPDETPIANVTIRLYNAAGTLVATTTTAGDGTWYFRTATNLAVDTQYFIVVDPAEFQSGDGLYGYSPTTLGAGTPLRDSDAAGVTPIGLGSQVGLVYTTGAAGQNEDDGDGRGEGGPAGESVLQFHDRTSLSKSLRFYHE